MEGGLNKTVVYHVSAIKKSLLEGVFLRGGVISRQFVMAINVFRFLPKVCLHGN